MKGQLLQFTIFTVIALLPAIVWLGFLFNKGEQGRKTLAWIFIGGALSVVPLWILDNLWNPSAKYGVIRFAQKITENPNILEKVQSATDIIWTHTVRLDIFTFLGKSIMDQHIYFVGIFIVVGILEEIVKQWMLRATDKKTLLIKSINDSIKFSFVAGLGFSFAENIKYFYQIWAAGGIQELIVPYVFRSVFTAAAHMVFSGIFGYFYGIGKFSIDYTKVNKPNWSSKVLKRVFNVSESEIYKEQMILKGLIIAIIMHAVFNFLLQLNIILPVIIYICIAFGFLWLLLKKKTGQLVLVGQISNSTMEKNDEDIVVELIEMWFDEDRFVDVIHICERLLKKNPNNNVVKLFKAKALDKLTGNSPYRQILNTIFPNQRTGDKSVLTKHILQKPKIEKECDMKDSEEFKKFKDKEREKKLNNGTFKLDL